MSVQEATPPRAAEPVSPAAPSAPAPAAPGTDGVAAPARPVPSQAPEAVVGPAPQAPPSGAPDAPDAPAPRRGRRVRRILFPILGVLAVGGVLFGVNYWWNSVHYVSTENAQISGQPVQVGALSTGRVAAVNATIGAPVHKGDLLAQVALPSQVGAGQNGTPKLDFLGDADTRSDVRAPIDGVVIAVPGAVGATVAAGTPIVTLVDPTQLYVNANVDETKIGRVKVGQTVDVHVDALGQTVPGRIEAVTPATAAVFSLLPSSNTSGNFTKVTQLVPVRIALNLGSRPALLGTSVEVKIRVQ